MKRKKTWLCVCPVSYTHQMCIRDRSQPGSLDLADPGIFGPFKGHEQLFQEFRRHADAVVLHHKLKASHPAFTGKLLFQGYGLSLIHIYICQFPLWPCMATGGFLPSYV